MIHWLNLFGLTNQVWYANDALEGGTFTQLQVLGSSILKLTQNMLMLPIFINL